MVPFQEKLALSSAMLESLIAASSSSKFEKISTIKYTPSSSPPTIKLPTSIKPPADEEPLDCKMEIAKEETRLLKREEQPKPTETTSSRSPEPAEAHRQSAYGGHPGFLRRSESPVVHSYPHPVGCLGPPSPAEPADLSNKKPENVTCVPEIDFIKEEINDAVSECSNSSDPDRLEVDMSQVSAMFYLLIFLNTCFFSCKFMLR